MTQQPNLLNPGRNVAFASSIDHLSQDLTYLRAKYTIAEIGVEKIHEMLMNYVKGKEDTTFARTPIGDYWYTK